MAGRELPVQFSAYRHLMVERYTCTCVCCLQGPDRLDEGYLHMFLLKYVCPRPACFGTMAPLPAQPDVCECSVCGTLRSDAEFLAEIEREDDDEDEDGMQEEEEEGDE